MFTNISCLTEEEKEERTLETEMEELENFLELLTEKGYDIDTTELGVFYIIHEEGTGPFPNAGDTLTLEYTGAFIDGNLFDSSDAHWQDGKWEFVYLEQELIHGFNNALSIMNKGASIDAIIPSTLAYGIIGYGNIPPYTTIVFSLKLHDLKPKS